MMQKDRRGKISFFELKGELFPTPAESVPPCSGEDAHDRPSPESERVVPTAYKTGRLRRQNRAYLFLRPFPSHVSLLLRFSINRAKVRAKVVAVGAKAWQNQVRWYSLTSLCWTGR